MLFKKKSVIYNCIFYIFINNLIIKITFNYNRIFKYLIKYTKYHIIFIQYTHFIIYANKLRVYRKQEHKIQNIGNSSDMKYPYIIH